ncbi:hypothetical protein FFI89_027125 [Bradyrhizobium sp. KBS0727]|uniref:hypothetical protein n=1 Tax=unclassified Bradyrhizobium TaxID=2631580 RepID=UPI00110E9A07|nr:MULTISPECIES: hypothetical protein [unclassified Bradyrhizobium]QDW40478.1 hypothetical protein FFI71_027130 [Bradyrhizobium sp. KBS0725]QDW47082.1 hypothetical protein FFI89_027125 [Bradyrhizobium sp. KBS0727]
MTRIATSIEDLARTSAESGMARVVQLAKERDLDAEEICLLAEVLARSGSILSQGRNITADLASTGAPTSLSTLLCPLYLCALGIAVPKLGVPGRPAGGIDVMAQIPGYRYRLDPREIQAIIDRCGYAHFVAGETSAPLDAALFAYRQKNGAQNVPELAAASLLAKKIACGVRFAGLDVRVAPHGNFGGTLSEAASSALKFCQAARIANIQALAFLTDARLPYQPFIGRSEALAALQAVLSRRADPWLGDHDAMCRSMSYQVGTIAGYPVDTSATGDILQVFSRNVEAQGGSMEAFEARVYAALRSHTRELKAERDGFYRLDLERLRAAFVKANEATSAGGEFPDRLGVILLVRPGRYVRRGDVLATARADEAAWHNSGTLLASAFQADELLDYAPGVEEIIRA